MSEHHTTQIHATGKAARFIPALTKHLHVSLDPNHCRGHCHRRLMSATLTARLLTRTIAGLVIVPRRRCLSWQVTKNYQIIGGQEELLN